MVEYLVRKKPVPEDFTEVRVAVIGNVDAGEWPQILLYSSVRVVLLTSCGH